MTVSLSLACPFIALIWWVSQKTTPF